MNWDAVAAIGQVLGSVAVFITLGYLAVQVRHSRSESRRALSQGRAEAIREINSLFGDQGMVSIMTKAMNALGAPIGPGAAALMERATLTREEAASFVLMARTMWAYFLQVMPSVDELPASERRHFENTIRFHYGTVGPSRVFYESQIKANEHPDAVRYMESVLAQPH